MPRLLGALLVALAMLAVRPAGVRAQAALLDVPPGTVLPSLTPLVRAYALGLGPTRPLVYRLQISTTPDFSTGIAVDSLVTSLDTVVDIQVVRPLPSERDVYFRVEIRAPGGIDATSQAQSRLVPRWLELISPVPTGEQLDSRRPLFVWRSAPVSPLVGPWRYELEITTNGAPVIATSGITDTTFRPTNDLESNASYRWSVRAFLPAGENTRETSRGTFGVRDPAIPTATVLFQNFPNPFPTPSAFATCFWFDLSEPGGRVELDVLDLRGNLIRNLVPGPDGQRDFAPGRYGRGLPGTGTNCDGRFIWDATGNDGRTVAPGVYLVRFRVAGGAPTFRRVLFRGR